MACSNGQDGIPTEEALAGTRCPHPNGDVVYHYEITNEGGELEDYWCRRCNFWLTPGEMEIIRERPDWEGGITEDQVYRDSKSKSVENC